MSEEQENKMTNGQEDLVKLIQQNFKTFGGGAGSDGFNPLTDALKDKPLMFALGVDVGEIVAFVLANSPDRARVEELETALTYARDFVLDANPGQRSVLFADWQITIDKIDAALTSSTHGRPPHLDALCLDCWTMGTEHAPGCTAEAPSTHGRRT